MKTEFNTPHLDSAWVKAFVVELRLRGVSGERIGSALAEVEAHCADSGESAEAAFGPGSSYAASLDLPRTETVGTRTLVESGLGLAGMLGMVVSVGSWRLGEQVSVTTGGLATLIILALSVVLLVKFAEPVLRQLVAHRWLAGLVGIVPVALFVAVLMLGRRELFELPLVAVAIASGIMLIANVALNLTNRYSDRVASPEAAGGVGTQSESRFLVLASKVGPFLYPILTAVMCLPALLR